MMVTIKDVGAHAGVSFTTVSHVINNTRVVSPETRARVEQAIRELGYSPNMVARGLRSGESKTVGIITIANSDPYFTEVLHGIQEYGWETGYGAFVSYTELVDTCAADTVVPDCDDLANREAARLASLSRRNVQGIILNSLQTDARLMRTLDSLNLPCVLFQRLIPGPQWDNFVCDDFQGTEEAMVHLLSLGHRRIALVEGFGYESHSVKYRKAAWKASLEAAGFEAEKQLVRDGRYDSAEAYRVTVELLSAEKDKRPTAIIYYSDTMAVAGIRAAFDLGLEVPKDVSIIGYDNLTCDSFTVPRLTSVSQQSVRLGRDMMARLAERILDPAIPSIVRTYPQELIVRESTGPVPV